MQTNQTKAFTLVELIVVITILAILATIAFLSFQNFSKSARDSSRAADMQTIYKGLKLLYLKNGSLEKPDNYVTILNGTNTLGYQGYAGTGTLNLIKLGGKGKDPTDNLYYSYYLDSTLKKVQLMGFLEENNQTLQLMGFENNYINTSYAASGSYIKRYPVVIGDKLGTLTYSDNTPIQDILTGSIDLAGSYSGTTFTSYFSNSSLSGTYVGSGSSLIYSILSTRNQNGETNDLCLAFSGNPYTDTNSKNIGCITKNGVKGTWDSIKGIWIPFDQPNNTLDINFNILQGQPSSNLTNTQIAGKSSNGLFYDNCEGGMMGVTNTNSISSLGGYNYCSSKGMRLPSLSEINSQIACNSSYTLSSNSAGNQTQCGYSLRAWYISNGSSSSWTGDRNNSDCSFTPWVYVRCVK